MQTIRPCDASGDILPVVQISDLLEKGSAIAKHIYYRLRLLAGEWWEYPEMGNEILQMMQNSRLTAKDSELVSSYLSTYIAETPGVFSVDNVSVEVIGREMRYSCTALTDEGYLGINFSTNDLI